MNIEKIKSNLHESLQLFEKSGFYLIAESEYLLSGAPYIKFNSERVKIGIDFKEIAFKVSELYNPEEFIIQLQKGLIA